MLQAHAGGSLQQGGNQEQCEREKARARGHLRGGGQCHCSGKSSKDKIKRRRWEKRGRKMPEELGKEGVLPFSKVLGFNKPFNALLARLGLC